MKQNAAESAVSEIQTGMIVGLGTGSTATFATSALGKRIQQGLKIIGIPTSTQTEAQAKSLGIPLSTLDEYQDIDLTIDGADEVERSTLNLIKGYGGALLREKIVEQQARRFIVIADESKIVERLGTGVLPVEVTPFARDVLEKRFAAMGLAPALRLRDGQPRITDEGHLILDVLVPAQTDIAETVEAIRALAGVVETGFFPTEATEALIATSQGVRRMTRSDSPVNFL